MTPKRIAAYSQTFLILLAAYITCLLVSNLIAGKMIQICGQILPAAVILFPLTYVLGDIFTEVYGFGKMRTVIWIGFACNIFAVLVYFAAITMPYPDFWNGQEAFKTVLGITPRILAASLVGYLFGEFSNAMLLAKIKVATHGKWLWMRTIGSTLVGEALDTIIFIGISFMGTVETGTLFKMMLFQYLWKVVYEALLTPLVYYAVARIKKREATGTFDVGETSLPLA